MVHNSLAEECDFVIPDVWSDHGCTATYDLTLGQQVFSDLNLSNAVFQMHLQNKLECSVEHKPRALNEHTN